eukprot:gene12044-biopygen5610
MTPRPQQQEQQVQGEDGAGTFEQCLPWGFVLHPDTLELGPPLKGSVAEASSRLRSCVGMFLTGIDDVDVWCPDDVKFTTDESNAIQMHFSRSRPAPPPQQTANVTSLALAPWDRRRTPHGSRGKKGGGPPCGRTVPSGCCTFGIEESVGYLFEHD